MPSKTFSVKFKTSGFRKTTSQMSSLSSDAEDAADALDEASDSAEEAGDDMGEAGSSASSMGSKISTAGKVGAAGLAAITSAISGAIAGVGTLVTQTAQYAKQVDRAAAQSGVSAERIQEIAFAAEQVSGADFENVRDGLKELALRSEEAAMGTGEAKEAFERLGISQQFLRSNSTAQIFSRVRQELQGASSKMRIMASEMIFGGEAGEKLVEVLGLSSEEMSRLSSRAQKTGAVLSSTQVAALEQTRSAWRSLTSEVIGLGRQLGAQFAPLVTQDIIPAFRSMVGSIRGALESISSLSGTTKGAIAAVTGLTTAVSAALTVYGAWPTIVAAASTAYAGLTSAATTAYAAITSPITGVVAAVAAVAAAAGLIYDNWSGVSSFFSTLWSSITSTAEAFGSVLYETFSLAWTSIKTLFARAINALIETVNDGLRALGAESYTIDSEVGIPSDELDANRQRLAEARSDLSSAMSRAGSDISGSLDGAWAAVRDSTSDAVTFVEDQLAGLGSAFSLPSASTGGSASVAASGSSSGGGAGESSSPGSSGTGGVNWSRWMDFAARAKQETKQLGQAGKVASSAISSGLQRMNRGLGTAVTKLLQGKDAAVSFGKTMVSALSSVITELVTVAAKLGTIAAIKQIAGISSGGITSIGGALQAAFMASGGLVTGPTLSVIGEGREDEAVLPLSRLDSMLQTAAMGGARTQSPSTGASRLAIKVDVRGETRREGRDIVTTYETSKRAQRRRGR